MPETEADTCRDYILPKLFAAGWKEKIREQVTFTDGRIHPVGTKHVRKRGRRSDYLLMAQPDFPIAVVEAKRAFKKPGDGLQQAMDYGQILDLKFAYSSNGQGITEHDFITGAERELSEFPGPEELWGRLKGTYQFPTDTEANDLLFPFNRELRTPDGHIKTPRYFQRIAINRAVAAVLKGRKRILLTMATGTGKTFTAMQIVWKLWKTKRRKRILYLADRDVLVQQPMTREFSAFGDAVWRIQGTAQKGREIYFALYQALAEDEARPGLYREYPRDYFDLIIVDECHRGSARDEGRWRQILEYFESATQIGMTATPLRQDNRDTYQYFGNPIYTYTLASGIDDGFLAPFRVHRVVPSVDATGYRPEKGQLDRFGRGIPDGLYTTRDFERTVSLLTRTEIVAKHLSDFMKKTGRMGKTIVFCVDIEHAQQMRMALNNANQDLARQHADYVVRIVGDEQDVGRQHLDNFIDPERPTPVIVTTSQLLSTGVDVPTCRNIVLFKPIGSMVEFKQIIGRGTRLCEEQDKLWFNILDYTGATRHFADPEFDGVPEDLTEEEIDEKGDPIPRPGRVPEPEHEPEPEPLPPPAPSARPPRKLYVDGVPMEISAVAVYELDSEGRRIRAVSYSDFAGERIRTLYSAAADLKRNWSSADERDAVLVTLTDHGVTLENLAEATGQPDADALDLLLHVAWQTPLRTRRERAEFARQAGKEFFIKLAEPARQILNELLDKYIDHGFSQLDDLQILQVPPLSGHGTVMEIAGKFGGPEPMKQAISELQKLVYAA
jgi:type I restriction enzyme R subunit